MELRVLQYFLAVTREQSISGAAASLYLSQPTLSRQLKELEEELKATRKDYMEEIIALVRQNGDLKEKIGVFMGGSAPRREDDEPTCPENYIIIDDTDSDPDDSDDDYVDEAGADIMESSTEQFFSRAPNQ